MDLAQTLARLDGVATLQELRDAGAGSRLIQRHTARGELTRVRQGVYAASTADPRIVAAARVGGRAAGVTAASLYGLWTPEHARLVVDAGHAARLLDPADATRALDRADPGTVVLWSRATESTRRRVGVSPLPDVVGQVLRTEPIPTAIAVLDSIMQRSPVSRFDIEYATAALPGTLRRRLRLLDPRAESGTESVVRVLLVLAGFRVQSQVRVPLTDLERIDLLVEGRIVVECDSSHHDDAVARERDSARDLALTALGFVVLRVRYRTAMRDPDAVVAAVASLLRRVDLRVTVAI